MKFIDLFTGLGGFNIATTKLGGKCVFACEIDPILRKIYTKNFNIEPAGDIRHVNIQDIPPHDLLCAGFPCQPFSKAGDQMGWKDTVRGTVFFNILEILRKHGPEFIILENVAHFVRHDDGNTYNTVRRSIAELGYDVQSRQLSPHQFGIPQIRERMYMVARRHSLGDFKWPSPSNNGNELSILKVLDKQPKNAIPISVQAQECIETWQEFILLFPKDEEIPYFPIWSMEFGATYPYKNDSLSDVDLSQLRGCKGSFGCSLDYWFRKDILNSVPNYARAQANAFPTWKKKFITQNRDLYRKHSRWIDEWLPKIQRFPQSLQKLEWNCKGEPRDMWRHIIQFRASGVRVKRATTSPSLVAMTTTQVPIITWEKRYMTVRECARLQSMGELKYFPQYTTAMAALGNAVNVRVVELILENLVQA